MESSGAGRDESAYIYVLIDPRTGHIRYVGKTFNLRRRFMSHISKAKKPKTFSGSWIKSLATLGLKPTMEMIEQFNADAVDDWQEAERYWISSFKFMGFELTNLESGGKNGKKLSLETCAKIGAAHRGKKLSSEHIANLKGIKHTIETRRKVSEALRKRGPEIYRRIADKMRGRKRSEIALSRASASLRGRKFTPEWLSNLSKAHVGNRQTEESRRKISETLKRRIRDGELIRDTTKAVAASAISRKNKKTAHERKH